MPSIYLKIIPNNQLKQAVAFINKFVSQDNGISDMMYSLSRTPISKPPKGT